MANVFASEPDGSPPRWADPWQDHIDHEEVRLAEVELFDPFPGDYTPCPYLDRAVRAMIGRAQLGTILDIVGWIADLPEGQVVARLPNGWNGVGLILALFGERPTAIFRFRYVPATFEDQERANGERP